MVALARPPLDLRPSAAVSAISPADLDREKIKKQTS